MDIKSLLELKAGVKGLSCEDCQVLAVYAAKSHKGTLYQGKQLPDWTSQSIKVGDNYGESYVNFKKSVNLKKDERIKLLDIEINEYEGKKSLNAKGYEILNLTDTYTVPEKQAPISAGSPQTTSKGIDTPQSQKQANTQEIWDSKERRTMRSMCLAYAKDLVLHGKIELQDMQNEALKMIAFIYWEDFIKADEMSEKEETIPFE